MARKMGRRQNGAGAVRQLSSGRWQAKYRNEDGRYVPAPMTFDTKLDANAWLRDYAAGDVIITTRQADPILQEYAETWLATRELKPSTHALYRNLLNKHILPSLGDLRLSRITPDKVRAWYATLNPNTPTQRAHAYALLRAIFTTAVSDDVKDNNPCRIRGAGRAKTQHRTRIATLDELKALFDAMPERLQVMIVLAAWCGLRFGEIAELRRADIDLTFAAVRIARGVVRVNGETVIGTPKSDAGTRTVSIPPHVLPLIEAHLDTHVGDEPDALLFPARHGGNLNPSAFYTSYYPAREAAGRPDLRFHDLRHTGATMAAATGATLAELMARMGHSTTAAAMRYQHAAAERDRAIAEAMSNLTGVTPLRRKRSA